VLAVVLLRGGDVELVCFGDLVYNIKWLLLSSLFELHRMPEAYNDSITIGNSYSNDKK